MQSGCQSQHQFWCQCFVELIICVVRMRAVHMCACCNISLFVYMCAQLIRFALLRSLKHQRHQLPAMVKWHLDAPPRAPSPPSPPVPWSRSRSRSPVLRASTGSKSHWQQESRERRDWQDGDEHHEEQRERRDWQQDGGWHQDGWQHQRRSMTVESQGHLVTATVESTAGWHQQPAGRPGQAGGMMALGSGVVTPCLMPGMMPMMQLPMPGPGMMPMSMMALPAAPPQGMAPGMTAQRAQAHGCPFQPAALCDANAGPPPPTDCQSASPDGLWYRCTMGHPGCEGWSTDGYRSRKGWKYCCRVCCNAQVRCQANHAALRQWREEEAQAQSTDHTLFSDLDGGTASQRLPVTPTAATPKGVAKGAQPAALEKTKAKAQVEAPPGLE